MTKTDCFIAVAIISLSACSSARVRVLPGDKTNKVVSTSFERDDAEESAIKEATAYCEGRGKQVVFLNSDKRAEYTGSMDENARNTIKHAADAAAILSAPVGVGAQSPAAGGVLGAAGVVGHEMTNSRDYRVELYFWCR